MKRNDARLWAVPLGRVAGTNQMLVRYYVHARIAPDNPEGSLRLYVHEPRANAIEVVDRSANVEWNGVRTSGFKELVLLRQLLQGNWRWFVDLRFPFAIRYSSARVTTKDLAGVILASRDGTVTWDADIRYHVGRDQIEAARAKRRNGQKVTGPDLSLGTRFEFPRLASAMEEVTHRAHTTATEALLASPGSVTVSGAPERFVRGIAAEVMARLNDGLSEAWDLWEAGVHHRSGYPLFQLIEASFVTNELLPGFASLEAQRIHTADERWARAITELLTLTSYSGPGGTYFGWRPAVERIDDPREVERLVEEDIRNELAADVSGTLRHDLDYLVMMGISGEQPRSGNYVPLVGACEHLATMGVLSRGHWIRPGAHFRRSTGRTISHVHAARMHLNAGSQSAVTFTTMLESAVGGWARNATEPAGAVSGTGEALIRSLGDGDAAGRSSNFHSPTAAQLVGCNTADFELGPGAIAAFANYPRAQMRENPSLDGGTIALVGWFPQSVIDAYEARCRQARAAHAQKHAEWVANGRVGPEPIYEHPTPPEAAAAPGPNFHADNCYGAHLGFILRGPKLEVGGTRTLFQSFDTGGFGTGASEPVRILRVPSDTGNQTGGLNHSGNMDYPPTETLAGSAPYRGMGFLPKATSASARALNDHVASILSRARPLGFARILITQAGVTPGVISNPTGEYFNLSSWLVAASPLLRMHTNATTLPIAKWIWALKDLPWAAECAIMLCIHIPRYELAQVLLDDAGGALSLDALCDEAARIMGAGNPDFGFAARRPVLARYRVPHDSRTSGSWGPFIGRQQRETFLANNEPQTLERQRLLYSLTMPLLEIVAAPVGPPTLLYQYRVPRPAGRAPFYHSIERDQLPLNRAVRPLTAAEGGNAQGCWTGDAASWAAWQRASAEAAGWLDPLRDLLMT